MKRAFFLALPLIFTAQACNFFFGDLSGDSGSGPRGIYRSLDSGQSWEVLGKVGRDKNLSNAQVLDIFIEPGGPNNLLASTFNAGVYASEDGGENWVPLLPKVGAYVSFVNPDNRDEIFTAGNRNSFPVILKSSDRGGTWVDVYSQPAGQGSVSSLVLDPRNSLVLYAGLTTGTLIRSIDGGNNWNAVTDFEDRIVKIAFSTDGRTLYVLGKGQGLRKSSDGGATWSLIELPEKASVFNDLTVDGSIYVADNKGLFLSDDSGVSWTKLSLPVTPELNVISAVAVNPLNRRQIFAAIRATLYRSDDRGATWRTESLPTNRVISEIAADRAEPNKIYIGLK